MTTTFTLDTSGEVPTDYSPLTRYRWGDLSPFTQGYIEALFAEHGEALTHEAWLNQTHIDIEHLGGRARAFADLAPETLARIIVDCEAFRSGDRGVYSNDWDSAGRGFWAMRQSQGGVPGFPPLTVILGDDGKVRFA